MTLHELLVATHALARRDAEVLLAHVLRRDRAFLLAHPESPVTAADQTTFAALATRRAAGEPLQHLTGQQEFYGLNLRVTADTLIPRPETEQLVEAVLLWATTLPEASNASLLRFADIGTGSGAIALALATHIAGARVLATDISALALAVARENADTFGVTQRIRFAEADLLPPDVAPATFHAIVSNPPYVPLVDAPSLQREVVDHEPHTALFAGPTGLDIYERLIPRAHTALRPGGLLALEFGFGQSGALRALLANEKHWTHVRILDDYAQIPRIALATRA